MKHYFLTMPVNHDGTDYDTGAIVPMSDNDAFFLNMVGIIRLATAEEIAAAQSSDDQTADASTVDVENADTQTDSENIKPETETQTGESEQTDGTETGAQTETQTDPNKPYSEWQKPDLIAELNLRGIDHSEATNNKLRAKLLDENDAEKTAQQTSAQSETAE